MDRTAEFREVVAREGGAPPAPVDYGAASAGGFVQRAAAMRGQLARLRKDLKVGIGGASDVQACRQGLEALEAGKSDLSDLGDRAPPRGRQKDLLVFRREVVQSMYDELQELASRVQTEQMQELRNTSEVAGFFTASLGGAVPVAPPPPPPLPPDTAGSMAAEEAVPEERLRAEEQQLLAAFETDLDQIQQVKQKQSEIASMLVVLATKVEEQHEVAEQIHADAVQATDYVKDACGHLKKANENKASYNFYIICWFLGAATFLLVFDFVDARYSWI